MNIDWKTFTYDEEWLRESARLEEVASSDVEAGIWLSKRGSAPAIDSAQQLAMLKEMRLQSILFTELRTWMESWGLGVGLEEAVICARRRIRMHLRTCTDEQQAYFDALLKESQFELNELVLRQQVIPMLCSLFTPEDWQAIAQAASQSIEQRVLGVPQLQNLPAVS